ncbi:MAG: right-handed parallel beta-helix repeat-containing protein [Kiritimatiellae bacterium]|nr:right-handed parallel beta-helix repeat-containing protein [Kiritimatiellia bacterium]
MKRNSIDGSEARRHVATACVCIAAALTMHDLCANAATYYVAPTGKATNPGTEAEPFAGVADAAPALRPGDTVLIRAGTYAPFTINDVHGTEQAPITIKTCPGERVTFDRTLNLDFKGQSSVILVRGGSYLVFDGFEITDSAPIMQKLHEIDLKTEEGLRIHRKQINPRGGGLGFYALNGVYPHHLTAQNLHIHHVSGVGIQAYQTHDGHRFLNNHIHDVGKYGVYLKQRNLVFKGNVIHHCVGMGAQFGNEKYPLYDCVIEDNICYNNGTRLYLWPLRGKPNNTRLYGEGINIWHGTGNLVRNNVAYNNTNCGILVNGGGTPGENRIFNNSCVGNGRFGISTTGRSVVRNNIVFGNKEGAFRFRDKRATEDHNLTDADPLFADAAKADFRLKPGSPAIDAGMPLDDVDRDCTGVARPQGKAHDLGAYEWRRTDTDEHGTASVDY